MLLSFVGSIASDNNITFYSLNLVAQNSKHLVKLDSFKGGLALLYFFACMSSPTFRKSFERKTMEPKFEQKPPRMKLSNVIVDPIPELDIETLKKNSHMLVSPVSQESTRKNSNGKMNCLCSPTTHAGSFRCRHHRSSGGMRRGRSVGSNLQALGSEAGSISDSLNAQ